MGYSYLQIHIFSLMLNTKYRAQSIMSACTLVRLLGSNISSGGVFNRYAVVCMVTFLFFGRNCKLSLDQ